MKPYKVTFIIDSQLNEVETLIYIQGQLESSLPVDIRDVDVKEA